MATYLLDLPAGKHAVFEPVAALPASDIAEMAGKASVGAQLYRNNCAACHMVDGSGARGLPALRNHAVLRQPNADNAAMAILEGVWPEHGQGMPGFAHELNDAQVAAVTNYVQASFGQGATVDAARVKELRQGGAVSPLLLLARGGMVVGLLAVLGLLVPWRRRRKQAARR